MPPPYILGDTFFGNITPAVLPHLYVIISNPDPQDQVVVVNLTSKTLNDRACILHPGDHPYVARESSVGYIWAEILTRSQIEAAVRHNVWQERVPFRPDILRRIQDGALVSDDFPPKYLNAVRASLVNPVDPV